MLCRFLVVFYSGFFFRGSRFFVLGASRVFMGFWVLPVLLFSLTSLKPDLNA